MHNLSSLSSNLLAASRFSNAMSAIEWAGRFVRLLQSIPSSMNESSIKTIIAIAVVNLPIIKLINWVDKRYISKEHPKERSAWRIVGIEGFVGASVFATNVLLALIVKVHLNALVYFCATIASASTVAIRRHYDTEKKLDKAVFEIIGRKNANEQSASQAVPGKGNKDLQPMQNPPPAPPSKEQPEPDTQASPRGVNKDVDLKEKDKKEPIKQDEVQTADQSQAKIDELQKQIRGLEESLERSEQEKKEVLKSKKSQAADRSQEASKLKAENKILKKSQSELTAEKEETERQIDQLNEEIVTLKEEQASVERNLKKILQEKEAAEKKLKTAEASIAELKEANRSLINDKKEADKVVLQTEANHLKALEQLREEIQKLEADKEKLEKIIKALQPKVATLESEKDKLVGEHAKQVEELAKRIEEKDTAIGNLMEKFAEVSSQRDNFEKVIDLHAKRTAKLEEEIGSLDARLVKSFEIFKEYIEESELAEIIKDVTQPFVPKKFAEYAPGAPVPVTSRVLKSLSQPNKKSAVPVITSKPPASGGVEKQDTTKAEPQDGDNGKAKPDKQDPPALPPKPLIVELKGKPEAKKADTQSEDTVKEKQDKKDPPRSPVPAKSPVVVESKKKSDSRSADSIDEEEEEEIPEDQEEVPPLSPKTDPGKVADPKETSRKAGSKARYDDDVTKKKGTKSHAVHKRSQSQDESTGETEGKPISAFGKIGAAIKFWDKDKNGK